MTGRVAGKVAFITGIARGQGRSHAIRLAEEGADIIGIDICEDIAGVHYAGATSSDMEQTVKQVEKLGRRIIATRADVRDIDALRKAVDDAVAELGRLDIVSANAGIAGPGFLSHELPENLWQDMIDINLTGVWHTTKVTTPHLIAGGRGGAIVLTNSAAGLMAYPHISQYVAAKHAGIGLMRTLALELAEHRIRVNTINPTQVDTEMVMNDVTYKMFCPDLDKPTRADFEPIATKLNALPVPWVESIDVSNALLFLASDEARYITGVTLPVDAGTLIK